jgi:spermidine dehydrogenase
MPAPLKINRRDFLNGVALGVAAGGTLSPLEILAQQSSGAYPPAMTGLRGSHPGSFEVAHRLAWAGEAWPRPEAQTDDTYDLIVVGGGISGLAAAFLYQQRTGGDGRVLVLDNHDDFGGHATRNEFRVDGKTLIGYGGSQSIDTPGSYSPVSSRLLRDVGIDVRRFYDYFDQRYFESRGLGNGVYFSREKYGVDSVRPNVLRNRFEGGPGDVDAIVGSYPIPDAAKNDLRRVLGRNPDYLDGLDREARIARLRSMSYSAFLTDVIGAASQVALLLRDTAKGWWGVGFDALSALEAYRLGMPGMDGLGLGELPAKAPERDEPYIFHFPDGNAGVARALVRKLNPAAIPGRTMEDIVTARADYGLLDLPTLNNRIRLNSTAVDVRHSDDERFVDVTYVRGEQAYRVRGRHVVLACYNSMIPYLCPEVPAEQKRALRYAEKVPLVYISIAIRNWKPLAELGYRSFHVPQAILMHSFGMDFPVSMGGYEYTRRPDEPTVLHGSHVPAFPDVGLTARDQHIAGRKLLYEKTFAELEQDIVRQLSGALEPGGFDAGRDLAGLTVNRWPHGYAYEYNDLSDPPDWGPDTGPHIAGRAPIGRISIANSDASAYAFVDGAIDAADRAVAEQLA